MRVNLELGKGESAGDSSQGRYFDSLDQQCMLKKLKKIILFILQGNGKEDSANTGKNIQKFISFTRRQSFQGERERGTSEDR